MPSPLLDEDLGLGQRVEHLGVQQFVAQLAVEALDVAVLHGLAGHDVVDRDAVLLCPRVEVRRGELRTVVAGDRLGRTVLRDEVSSAAVTSPEQKPGRANTPRHCLENTSSTLNVR